MDSAPQRIEHWVLRSHRVAAADHMLVFLIQSLGRHDSRLIEAERQLDNRTSGQFGESQSMLFFDEHICQSYLWILGAYEVIRTLDQRARRHSLFDSQTRGRIRELKRRFNRLRVPLAKLETATSNPNDNPVALPAYAEGHGVAWKLQDNLYVSRRELADSFLELLCTLPGPSGGEPAA